MDEVIVQIADRVHLLREEAIHACAHARQISASTMFAGGRRADGHYDLLRRLKVALARVSRQPL